MKGQLQNINLKGDHHSTQAGLKMEEFKMCKLKSIWMTHVKWWQILHGKWPNMGNGHTWEMATYGKWPHMGNSHTWEMATHGKLSCEMI